MGRSGRVRPVRPGRSGLWFRLRDCLALCGPATLATSVLRATPTRQPRLPWPPHGLIVPAPQPSPWPFPAFVGESVSSSHSPETVPSCPRPRASPARLPPSHYPWASPLQTVSQLSLLRHLCCVVIQSLCPWARRTRRPGSPRLPRCPVGGWLSVGSHGSGVD